MDGHMTYRSLLLKIFEDEMKENTDGWSWSEKKIKIMRDLEQRREREIERQIEQEQR